MRFITLVLVTLLTTSCANYLNNMYAELDGPRNKKQSMDRKQPHGTFDQYRSQNRQKYSSSTKPNVEPAVKRNYNNQKKRVTTSSFQDNGNYGSLWAGSGNENYLFTKNKWKRNGDIILVNVQTKLKNSITMELKRAFPAKPKIGEDGKKETAAATPAGADAEAGAEEAKVHDKISGVIIEEISKDHLLVRGQKSVLYKNRKHLVELQALISRKDINEDDTVDSTKFLENSIHVLR